MTHLRDPDAIYEQSFAIIRAEADLAHLPPELHAVAVRMIHACGMVDLADDVIGDPRLPEAVEQSLGKGEVVLCDSEMVAAGVHSRVSARCIVTLNDPAVPNLAKRLGTTRSAAALELWRDRLAGAVVVIGNAPTALFHLLEMIDAGAPKPAAIIATPVGFVGAAESKAELAANPRGIPFLTVRGRRGGSAIAAAALNAIALT
jgi:precorrin-8X/cobalt-precorrin-8 methylmutase